MEYQTIHLPPIGKPRMTRRDKWARRACVQTYWRWKDLLLAMIRPYKPNATSFSFRAYFKFPESYSAKKKGLLLGKPHDKKPDIDNILKALLDALFKNDSGIASVKAEKFWDDGRGERLEVAIA